MTTTTFDPNSGIADIPENYIKFSFQLEETSNETLLTLTQGDFSKVAEGEKRYQESQSGWKEMVIPLMKKLMDE